MVSTDEILNKYGAQEARLLEVASLTGRFAYRLQVASLAGAFGAGGGLLYG